MIGKETERRRRRYLELRYRVAGVDLFDVEERIDEHILIDELSAARLAEADAFVKPT